MNTVTLYINSKDREIKAQPSTNFIYRLFPLGMYNIESYYIKSVTIPLTNYVTVYPSTEGAQHFIISDFFGDHTVVITSGNYTAQQLAALMQTEMNAATGGAFFNVSYSTVTNKFVITTTGVFTIKFNENNALFPYQSLGSVIGFRDVDYNPLSISAGAEAPYEINLSGPLNYYIRSSALTVMTNSFFQGNKDNVICSVPNNGAPFTVLTFLNPAPIYEPLFNIKMSQLDLQLIDEYGNEPLLNADWTITISFKCNV